MVETKIEKSETKFSSPKVFCKEQPLVSHIGLPEEKKKLKFPNGTICKISSPDNNFLDQVITFLAVGFNVSPTSAKMFNDETKQFFIFILIEPKEEH